jgi:hypothetical protein
VTFNIFCLGVENSILGHLDVINDVTKKVLSIYSISIGNFLNQTPSLMPSINVQYSASAQDKAIIGLSPSTQ